MSFNLINAFYALADAYSERIAIDAPEIRLTYRELMQRAFVLACFLGREGVVSGDRIGIALTRNDETVVAMIGAWMLDATALMVDFRMRAAEREKIAENTGLKFFLEDRPAPGRESYPSLKLNSGWEQLKASEEGVRPKQVFENDIAIIGVSSGTSGVPQSVALSHECLYSRYTIARTSPQWNPGGRFLVTTPMAFSATRKHVLSRLLDGGTVIFTPLLVSPNDIVNRVKETQANAMLTVPVIARQLMSLAPEEGPLFPEMDWMMCCGAPMFPQEKLDARDRLSNGFVQNYGSTMAGMITLLETSDIDEHSESVGKPLPHVQVEIVGDDYETLSRGEAGQIRVRTPGIGSRLPHAVERLNNKSDLVIDGWIYPGDIGKLDDDGFLHIVGRTSDLIIRAGVNVYPTEIEDVLASHPAVAEAAVVGWPDQMLGEEIAAFAVLAGDGQVQAKELLGWCRSRLQPDKQPRDVFLISEMPRNTNGKLVRRDLLAMLPERA
jgi:acyl-coenzyme A synthetase/AMP-(fatty) acid ligase